MPHDAVQQVEAGSVSGPTVTFACHSFRADLGMTGGDRSLGGDQLRETVGDLLRFADADWTDGWFGITQEDHSWIGHGADAFLETVTSRYEDLPGDRDTHHREVATWVGHGGPHATAMVLSGQPRTGTDVLDRVTVGLLTDGYPITPGFIHALEDLPVTFGNAHDWDRPHYEAGREGPSRIAPSDVIAELTRHENDRQVDELLCHNPFHGHPEALAAALGLEEDLDRDFGICRTIAGYDRLRAHIWGTPYAPDRSPEGYDIERFAVTSLDAVSAPGTTAVNVRVDVRPRFS